MRRTALLAAAIGGLVVSSSFAGFSITASAPTAQGSNEARLFRAINDGVGTGTQIKAVDLTFTLSGGKKAYFLTSDNDFDGIDDAASISNAAANNNFSFIRLGTADDTFIVETTPPRSGQPNGFVGGISQFTVVATTTSNISATGLGALFARLVMDPGTSGTITGSIGGDLGAKVPVSFSFGNVVVNDNPTIVSVVDAAVNFGSLVSTPLPFSATVNAADLNAADVLSLATGTLPAGVTIGSITGGGTSPETFVISGTVAYPGSNTTLTVPFTVSDGAGGSVAGDFDIVVTPEPTALGALALGGMILGRRRK